ncbi:MAG TPA: NAD(P)H-dependent glycerol-3-phosphate dehydrogenase [Thermoleophilia bacterium]|nr:NAD(P)H-dependent glycerol-3-phosphate dehydrogenase [Thermoleophilia bacterium]
MNVTVIGSGSWGCAFARLLWRNGHVVQVLTLTKSEAAELNATHANPHFLPGVEFSPEISFVGIDDASLDGAELVVYAVPTQAIRQVASWTRQRRPGRALQLSLAKGLELHTLLRPTQVIEQETEAEAAALSGPNHAEEISRDMPTGTVIACGDGGVARKLQQVVTGDVLRVYTNEDVVGVEFCGAAKNPIAIAVGIADGLGFGDNTRAALMTRSLAEVARLGMRLGADFATFAGLAGLGDLIATCTSRHSRNRRAGELIGGGERPDRVQEIIGQVVEGIPTTYALHDLSRKVGVEMPVTEAVYDVLENKASPADGVRSLMSREVTSEASQDIMSLIGQIKQSATKTAKRHARRLLP